MSINKIRIRNLDDEVLKYFRKTEDKIGYDQLNSDVVTEIKNNESSTDSPYDDTEIRNRVINIENTMVSKNSADSLYATKKDYDTSTVINTKINKAQGSMRNEFNDLKNQFVTKEAGNITEDLLSYDLKRKINSHVGSSDSGNTSKSSDDVKKLEIQINRNVADIASLNNTLNTNVYLKNNPIQISDLDESTRLLINNARQNNTLIGINDLNQTLKNKLDEKLSVPAQSIIDTMYKNSNDGQVLIVSKTQGADSFSTQPKHIFRNDVFIFKLDEKYLDENIEQKNPEDPDDDIVFSGAKIYAKNNEYTYIANIGKESLLTYNKETDSWTENTTLQTVYNNIAGCFVLSYPDNIIYYCKGFRKLIEVFNPNDYVKEQDIENTIEYFEDLDSRLEKVEKELQKKEDLDSRLEKVEKELQKKEDLDSRLEKVEKELQKKLDLDSMIDMDSTTEPQNAENGSLWIDPNSVTYIKTDSGWVKLRQ